MRIKCLRDAEMSNPLESIPFNHIPIPSLSIFFLNLFLSIEKKILLLFPKSSPIARILGPLPRGKTPKICRPQAALSSPSPSSFCVLPLSPFALSDGEAAFIASHQLLSLSKDGYLPENYKCNANITLTFKNKSGSNVPMFHSKHGRRPSTQTP